MDNEIKNALKTATQESFQPPELAVKLISWLDSLSDGKTTILNKDEVNRHIESILDSTNYYSEIEQILNQM